jgi:hypothetical protein
MNKKTKNILAFFLTGIIIVVFVAPYLVQAQSGEGLDNEVEGEGADNVSISFEIVNPFKQDTIRGLIETIVNEILIPIGGVVAVVMIIYAGFLYVTAKGDPGQIKKAHDALLWAVIGAAILLGAWVISRAISATIDQLRT